MSPPPSTFDFWQKFNVNSPEDPFLASIKDLFVGHKKGTPTPAKLKLFWDTALNLGKTLLPPEDKKANKQKIEAARQEGLEDGQKIGFKEGRQAGLSEGKSIGAAEAKTKSTGYSEGYSAGWKAAGEREEQGIEKERKRWLTSGHSLTGACQNEYSVARVAVAIATDPPCPIPKAHSVATQTEPIEDDMESVTSYQSVADAPPTALNWADDAESIPIYTSDPQRDFTALRTKDVIKPFSSLQRRVRHAQRITKERKRPCDSQDIYLQSHRQHIPPPIRKSKPTNIGPPKQLPSQIFSRVSQPTLDWVHDPRLSRLGQALQDLGWFLPHKF